MSTEIEQLFGGANAEDQNILLHIKKERGYDFFEKTPKTTMTIRLLEDLHELGYKIEKQENKSDIIGGVGKCEEAFEASRESVKGAMFLNADEHGDYFSAFVPKYPSFEDYLDDK